MIWQFLESMQVSENCLKMPHNLVRRHDFSLKYIIFQQYAGPNYTFYSDPVNIGKPPILLPNLPEKIKDGKKTISVQKYTVKCQFVRQKRVTNR